MIHNKHRESTSNIKREPRPTLDADQQSEEETCNEVGPKDVKDENYTFDGVEESLTDSTLDEIAPGHLQGHRLLTKDGDIFARTNWRRKAK